MLLFEEMDLVERVLLNGLISAAVANEMVRHGGTFQRDLFDRLILNVCKSYLGEGEVDVLVGRFQALTHCIESDASIYVGVSEPVSRMLNQVTQGYRQLPSRSQKITAIGQLVRNLSSGKSDMREAALTVRTRVLAGRVRDDVTHPYIGVYKMKWTDIDVLHFQQTPEMMAIDRAPFDIRDWELGDTDDREVVELRVRDTCDSIGWTDL